MFLEWFNSRSLCSFPFLYSFLTPSNLVTSDEVVSLGESDERAPWVMVIITKVTVNIVVQKMDPAAPGPQDPSVLTMKEEHRSTPLWDVEVRIMFCINCTLIMKRWYVNVYLCRYPIQPR